MKTTIDLPDDVLKLAKLVAVERRTTLKDLVVQGLIYATGPAGPNAEKDRRERAARLIAGLQATNTAPMKPLSRDEIHDRKKGRQ